MLSTAGPSHYGETVLPIIIDRGAPLHDFARHCCRLARKRRARPPITASRCSTRAADQRKPQFFAGTYPTTVAREMRNARMQGTPPICFGSPLIRVNFTGICRPSQPHAALVSSCGQDSWCSSRNSARVRVTLLHRFARLPRGSCVTCLPSTPGRPGRPGVAWEPGGPGIPAVQTVDVGAHQAAMLLNARPTSAPAG